MDCHCRKGGAKQDRARDAYAGRIHGVNLSRSAQGRPVGYLAAWLLACPGGDREQHMAIKRQWAIRADYGHEFCSPALTKIVGAAATTHPWLQVVLDSESRPAGVWDDDIGEPRGLCI